MKSKPLGENSELKKLQERVSQLETALIDYVQVYGLRDKARAALSGKQE